MARSLELPAIVGTGSVTSRSENGDYHVYGYARQRVYVSPTSDVIERLRAAEAGCDREKRNRKAKDLRQSHAGWTSNSA